MKTIALVDTFWGGHHPTYLKFFSKSLLELGHDVIALCPEPDDMHVWIDQNCAGFTGHFQAFKLQEPKPRLFSLNVLQARERTLLRWQQAAQGIAQIDSRLGKVPDLIFFTWLDSYLGLLPAIINRLFPYRWSGLYFQPRQLRIAPRHAWMRRGFFQPLSVLQSSNCVGIGILDEGIADVLQQKVHKPVILFPDFTDESPPDHDSPLIQEISTKAAGRKIVGLLGSLDKRKGILTLLRLSQQISTPWFFVFAGNFAEASFTVEERKWIHAVIGSNPKNCFFHLARIPSEAAFNAVVQTCDCLYAAYENFPLSSNLLIKAAIFEKPIIVSENYCMGERVKRFRLGFTVKEKDIPQTMRTLEDVHQQILMGKSSFQGDFQGYRLRHSHEQLKASLCDLLALI